MYDLAMILAASPASRRLMGAIGVVVLLGLLASLLYKLVAFLIPRDCPYCDVPDLVSAKRLGEEDREKLIAAAERTGLTDEVMGGRVCRSCNRVADPQVMMTADPNEYWCMEGEEVYPPMPCRRCGGHVITGGPKKHRTCQACGTIHSWWKDDETGYKFCVPRTADKSAFSKR